MWSRGNKPQWELWRSRSIIQFGVSGVQLMTWILGMSIVINITLHVLLHKTLLYNNPFRYSLRHGASHFPCLMILNKGSLDFRNFFLRRCSYSFTCTKSINGKSIFKTLGNSLADWDIFLLSCFLQEELPQQERLTVRRP